MRLRQNVSWFLGFVFLIDGRREAWSWQTKAFWLRWESHRKMLGHVGWLFPRCSSLPSPSGGEFATLKLCHLINERRFSGYFFWHVSRNADFSTPPFLSIPLFSPLGGGFIFKCNLGHYTCSTLDTVLGCEYPSGMVFLHHLLHLELRVRNDTTI